MRLTKRMNGDELSLNCDICPMKGKCSNSLDLIDCAQVLAYRLAAYEDAEEQGLLVRLPKTLYQADSGPRTTYVTEWEVTGVRYYNGAVQAYTVKTTNVRTIIYGREIGKTVFLNREEAVEHAEREKEKEEKMHEARGSQRRRKRKK